jgi:hypothetical protein
MGELQRRLNVSNRKTIAKIVADLNALPLYPFGRQPINCPASAGHVYALTFYYPVRGAESVQVEADACRIVQERGRRLRWTLPLKQQGLLNLLEQVVSSI